MKPLIVGALILLGALAGLGIGYATRPPTPEPVVEIVEVPTPAEDTNGSCKEGFILAVDFIHSTIPTSMHVTDAAGSQVGPPLVEWFPAYSDMKAIIDDVIAEQC